MKRLTQTLTGSLVLTAWLALIAPFTGQAAEVSGPLRHANVNLSDTGSLQRGAKHFVNHCLSCHSIGYMRYERMADDLGITHDVLESNLMFAANKKGALMKAAMTKEQGAQFFGKAPPDLSVIARAKSPDYLYTYLTGFFKDPSTGTGWNNLVYASPAMPHVMWEQQGTQVPVFEELTDEQKANGDQPQVAGVQLVEPGTMTPKEFDLAMTDLTSFLVYVAEPAKLKRYTMGVWVLLFLGVLLALTWFLKKEYWRDVH